MSLGLVGLILANNFHSPSGLNPYFRSFLGAQLSLQDLLNV